MEGDRGLSSSGVLQKRRGPFSWAGQGAPGSRQREERPTWRPASHRPHGHTGPRLPTPPPPPPERVCPHSVSSCVTGFWTLAFTQLSQGRGKGEGMQGMRKRKRNGFIFHGRGKETLQITKCRPLVTVLFQSKTLSLFHMKISFHINTLIGHSFPFSPGFPASLCT